MDTPYSHSPIHWSATEIGRRIARREISAVEATQAFIARIEEVNPQINAVVFPRFEAALCEAKEADERLARGDLIGPLHGVPITVKECFHLAGTPSTMGLDTLRHEILPTDGVLVSRLRQAGAIVLGKTNIPQLMIWFEADNPVYGRTNNPWNLDRTPGGSTGGEAAIIAARGSPLGLGNDLGGSIRVPCHFCGIHGLKPTSRRLTNQGSRRALRGFEGLVTQAGPMARHVEDLWLGLSVLARNADNEFDLDVAPSTVPDPAAIDVSQLKIAAWTDNGVFPSSVAVARAVREAAAALRSRGAEVVELSSAEVQGLLATSECFDVYCRLVGADGGADARRLTAGSRVDWRLARLMWLTGLSKPLRAVLLAGLRLAGQHWPARLVKNAQPRSVDVFWQLSHERARLAAASHQAVKLAGYDAFLCPPYALPAPPHVTAFDLLSAASYSMHFNLLGWPAGTVGVTRVRPGEEEGRPQSRDLVLRQAQLTDRGSAGLPVGIHVAALPWREDVVLAVMAVLEQEFRGRPDYPGNALVPSVASPS